MCKLCQKVLVVKEQSLVAVSRPTLFSPPTQKLFGEEEEEEKEREEEEEEEEEENLRVPEKRNHDYMCRKENKYIGIC